MTKNTLDSVRLVERGVCPLCDSCNQTAHIAFPGIPVVRCTFCGFIYSSLLMPGEELRRYYQLNFGSERHRFGQIINSKINCWAIRRLLRGVNFANFLDVGAGYGYLLKELQDHLHVTTTGVELSEQEAIYGAEQLNVDLRNCDLLDSGLQCSSFDVVACFEVLEHIPNPKDFIDNLFRYLKPSGHLLIMTDNFESRVAKALGPDFPKWIPHTHVSHFSSKTLERLLVDRGLMIEMRMSYTPWELWAKYIYNKFLGINKTPAQAFDLSSTLNAEMHGNYRLYSLRRVVNALWAKLTVRNDLEGALMYVIAKRK